MIIINKEAKFLYSKTSLLKLKANPFYAFDTTLQFCS